MEALAEPVGGSSTFLKNKGIVLHNHSAVTKMRKLNINLGLFPSPWSVFTFCQLFQESSLIVRQSPTLARWAVVSAPGQEARAGFSVLGTWALSTCPTSCLCMNKGFAGDAFKLGGSPLARAAFGCQAERPRVLSHQRESPHVC